MHTKNLLFTASLLALLVACSQIPKESYYSRGQPESLIDSSSEVVDLKLDSPGSLDQVTRWINHDQPTRAVLKCAEGSALCDEAQNVLHQFSVPVKYTASQDNRLSLIYERLQARDCESRYIDNMINPYNLNHPTFGCTIASNIVQMVADKRTFTNPTTMESANGVKAAQAMDFHDTPSRFFSPKSDSDFQAIATEQSLQTNGLTGGTSR